MTSPDRLKTGKQHTQSGQKTVPAQQFSANCVKVEFHCHSKFSFDGHFSPEEMADNFKNADVKYCSVTDHDTVLGQENLKAEMNRRGIEYITGAEISVSFPHANLHLLAYGFDVDNTGMAKLFKAIEYRRLKGGFKKRNKLIKKLHSLLSLKGPKLVGDLRLKVIDDYSLPSEIRIKEIVGRIHEAGGIACMAHPLTLTSNFSMLDQFLKRFKLQGLDGLEAIYKPYSKNIQQQLIGLGQKHGLIITSGSDYHGFKRAVSGSSGLKDSPFHYAQAEKIPQEPGVGMPENYLTAFLEGLKKYKR